MWSRLDRLVERFGPVVLTIVLAQLCIVLALAGIGGLYFLLTGGAGVLQDGVLYFLIAFAVMWTGVWLVLLFSVVGQALRRQ